jgi:hypothetical protein
LIDKLDLGVNNRADYTRAFSKVLSIADRPEWRDKVWKQGGHFRRRGDLREVSGGELPVILHMGNLHDRKADNKVELIETGKMGIQEMRDTVESMFVVPADECRVLRLDCAADIKGTPVEWFRQRTYVAGKQNRRAWLECELGSRQAHTLTAGVKPRQLRIYDKTGHRAALLASELRKMTRQEREFGMTFEKRWGYPQSQKITRVERQLGGGEPKTRGYGKMGYLNALAGFDPFEQIVFPSDLEYTPGKLTDPRDYYTALALRQHAEWDGIENMWDALRQNCVSDWQFYKLKKRYKAFILCSAEEETGTSRQAVRAAFVESLSVQLAA